MPLPPGEPYYDDSHHHTTVVAAQEPEKVLQHESSVLVDRLLVAVGGHRAAAGVAHLAVTLVDVDYSQGSPPHGMEKHCLIVGLPVRRNLDSVRLEHRRLADHLVDEALDFPQGRVGSAADDRPDGQTLRKGVAISVFHAAMLPRPGGLPRKKSEIGHFLFLLVYLLVSDIFRGWFHQTISIGWTLFGRRLLVSVILQIPRHLEGMQF